MCKAVQVKVTDDNLFGEQRRGHLCHCANCRKVAGGLWVQTLFKDPPSPSPFPTDLVRGALCILMPWEPHIHSRHCVDEMYYLIRFGANLLIEEEKVQFPKGKDNLKKYDDPDTMSGTPVGRYFCQTCGVPIMSVTPLYKGKIVLKLGIYPKVPHPEWESFAERRQAWEKPLEGAVQYKTKSFGEKMPGSI